jgi:hypothetical protein
VLREGCSLREVLNSRGNFGTEGERCRQSKLAAQFLASVQQAPAAYSMALIRYGSEAHRIEARGPLRARIRRSANVLTSDNVASRNPFVSATSGRGRCSDTDLTHLLEDRQSVAVSFIYCDFRGLLW